LKKRTKLPNYEELQKFTVEQLSKLKDHTSLMGYVFKFNSKFVFDSWRGRDRTNRALLHYRGISLELNDVDNVYPKIFELEEEENRISLAKS